MSARIARLCANHVGEAVDVLVDLMRHSDRDSVRLGAAKAIVDAAREFATSGEDRAPETVPVVVVVRDGDPMPEGARQRNRAEVMADARRRLRAG